MLCGSYTFWHPMKLCIFLVFTLVTWVCGEQPTNRGSSIAMLSQENYGTRIKRTATSPTAHPSPELVAVLTKQTEFVTSVLRKALSLDVKWFYAMARKSKAEVVVFLVFGVTFTFIVILIQLALLAKILVPPLPILGVGGGGGGGGGNKIPDQPDMNFPLPYWMNNMES